MNAKPFGPRRPGRQGQVLKLHYTRQADWPLTVLSDFNPGSISAPVKLERLPEILAHQLSVCFDAYLGIARAIGIGCFRSYLLLGVTRD